MALGARKMENLPGHLQKYIVEQNYERYTPVDQAVWRYILTQLKKYLGVHAEESYEEGLKKTGIEIDQIPLIENVSAKLEKFGWRALPVSGFSPPAAFMELQSLGVLPIACDMRSMDHLLYTPAPDIVHEAAGHAPFLANEKYARYLQKYAQVAKKAILSKQDLDQYEAIRELSDIKENPNSTAEEIKNSEEKLKTVSGQITFISEGAELSRMNWWTAEYGLIKKNGEIKIYGAGLLSSIGEAKWCLSDQVKKIPLSPACVHQGYDITEPQPQLFVAESFDQLSDVLEEFSTTMAYKQGGIRALEKLQKAETVNTVQFENDIQVSGVLKKYIITKEKKLAYLQFTGPTQLSFQDKQITGHDRNYHQQGYGSPVGLIENPADLILNQEIVVRYQSGVQIKGRLTKILQLSPSARILTFADATCRYGEEILFQPDWGMFDVIIAQDVTSGFGGPADRVAYGEIDDFKAAKIEIPKYSAERIKIFSLYQSVRDFRQNKSATEQEFNDLFLKISQQAPDEWLLFVELVEISYARGFSPGFLKMIQFHLEKLKGDHPNMANLIDEGLLLSKENSDATH